MTETWKLIEKSESHVVILFLLRFLLLLGRSSSCSSSRSVSSSGSGSSGPSRACTGSNSGDQSLKVARLKDLVEESKPVWLNLNTGSLEDGVQLLLGDGHVIISKDESNIDTGKFKVGN